MAKGPWGGGKARETSPQLRGRGRMKRGLGAGGGQQSDRLLHYMLDGEAVGLQDGATGCGGAESFDADHPPAIAYIAFPTLGYSGFYR